jgi:protein-disulfide isomerase
LVTLLVTAGLVMTSCGGAAETEFAPISVVVDSAAVSPLPTSGSYAPLDVSGVGDSASASLPIGTAEGLEVGFTADGYPYRGSPDAPVTLIEYSDYACPFCGRHTATTAPELLAEYGASGEVQFIFRELPLPSLHPTAPVAHVAAHCAGEQSAQLYWDMHDAIFASQGAWTNLADPTSVLLSLAEELGTDMIAFQECATSGRGEDAIAVGAADAAARGFDGTPSFELVGTAVDGTYNIVGAQPIRRPSPANLLNRDCPIGPTSPADSYQTRIVPASTSPATTTRATPKPR